jgi:hypothetical protein
LFEGKVIKRMPSDLYRQPAWLVQPEHFFFGKEKVDKDQIILVSPTEEDNGVILIVGKRYRFGAVDVNRVLGTRSGPLFIWKGLVLELK